jgi:hypothetical protein
VNIEDWVNFFRQEAKGGARVVLSWTNFGLFYAEVLDQAVGAVALPAPLTPQAATWPLFVGNFAGFDLFAEHP